MSVVNISAHPAVAVLAVGSAQWPRSQFSACPPSYPWHLSSLLENVVKPLAAHIYAVTDFTEGGDSLCCSLLPAVFGGSLRQVGLLADTDSRAHAFVRQQHDYVYADLKAEGRQTMFTLVPPPNRTYLARSGRNKNAHVQWYRLAAAWSLMELDERSGQSYDLVIKVRFDETPMQPWLPSNLLGGARLFAVHAATDHTFWGRRDAMRVAAGTWDAMDAHFFSKEGWEPLTRPLCVGAMLRSWLALPAQALRKASWTWYNKLITLPYPDFGLNPNRTAAGVVSTLRAASDAGWDCFDPQATDALSAPPPNMSVGIVGSLSRPSIDYMPGLFVTEKDFLVWLLMNNVSVCDLGAGTTSILYKGMYFDRPSRDCAATLESGVGAKPNPAPHSLPLHGQCNRCCAITNKTRQS